MFPTVKSDLHFTANFNSISLDQLNEKAAMLIRKDNKYVLHGRVLDQAIEALSAQFDVLEIEGRRSFFYETCYFDDVDLRCYHDHRQGRRQRFKVRVRRYPDSDLCFVEVKLKDKRGSTVKRRLAVAPDEYGTLNVEAERFVDHVHRELYGRGYQRTLASTLEIRYERVTLVSKNGGERITLDRQLEFSSGQRWHAVEPEIIVIETKSKNGNGIADSILRGLHQHSTNSCSKYCIGMNLTNAVQKRNKFLPALRKLGSINSAPLRPLFLT